MSTDTRPLQNPTRREAGAEEPGKPRIELSLTQVLAGALAAMTAAYLGSRLSVAGTVVGAAVASVVAAVASSVYSASLRTTQHHVRTVFQGRVDGSGLPTTVESVGDRETATPAEAPAQPSAPAVDSSTAPGARRPRLSWKNVLVAAVAAFALAGAVLTGVELATGSALSGGDGTTVGQVAEPQRRDPQPVASPSAEPSEPSPSATPSATAEPSPEPSSTPSSTPEATPEATPGPAPEPSTAAPTPSAPAPSTSTPEATPTPSADATPADEG
ncbi:MAG: hypothetical protein AVDCRST_MAG48-387 [uncultured Friedmanniella sp.]|uniref:Uncharacterized protein n=1 Tax=uncultured Friedmanniella sp. TaxID=335381 RepID=A0A6J4JW90_9ACTN|nr:MAG: hypothetical protein AVDCRST_MAG48-387 [uncultured Friedmanniella sp.]